MAAAAPMDMLRRCRDIFAGRARANRIIADDPDQPSTKRSAADAWATRNEEMVAEIDDTLQHWG